MSILLEGLLLVATEKLMLYYVRYIPFSDYSKK